MTTAPADLEAAVLAAVREPFDVISDLPLRALLLRSAPGHHVLVLVLHHIAGDGWSLARSPAISARPTGPVSRAGAEPAAGTRSSTPTTHSGSTPPLATASRRRAFCASSSTTGEALSRICPG
ncbi:hypothetical protein NKH18_05420 [Streptomyces sp. M10(2022)]